MAGAKGKKASSDALNDLHNMIAQQLAKKLESGEWDAATMGAAIRFLKDNGITAVAAPGSPLSNLLDELKPEEVSEEDYQRIMTECRGNA